MAPPRAGGSDVPDRVARGDSRRWIPVFCSCRRSAAVCRAGHGRAHRQGDQGGERRHAGLPCVADQDDDALHRLRPAAAGTAVARPEDHGLGERRRRGAVAPGAAQGAEDRAALSDPGRGDQVGERRGDRDGRLHRRVGAGVRRADEPVRPVDGHDQHHVQERQRADPRGAHDHRARHGDAGTAADLRLPAVLQHLRPGLDVRRPRHGEEHQPAGARGVSGRRRDQDRLHQGRRVQRCDLGAAWQPAGDGGAARRQVVGIAQRRGRAADGSGLRQHAGRRPRGAAGAAAHRAGRERRDREGRHRRPRPPRRPPRRAVPSRSAPPTGRCRGRSTPSRSAATARRSRRRLPR